MRKTCARCGRRLALSAFHNNKARKDGKQSECIKCRKEMNKKWFADNPDVIVRADARKKEERARFIWEFLREHPCIDCGETDPRVLEFDHVRGQKIANIMYMYIQNVSEKTFLAEVAKCEVRCANCHKRITQTRGGCWRAKMYETDPF